MALVAAEDTALTAEIVTLAGIAGAPGGEVGCAVPKFTLACTPWL